MNNELRETEPHGHEDHVLSRRFAANAHEPRYMGTLPDANGRAVGVGSCGDSIEVSLAIDDGRVRDIRHAPRGCTYTVACGSAMCHLAHGRTLEELLWLTPEEVAAELDGLPDDHMHCATLAVNTLGEALDDYYQKIWGRAKTGGQPHKKE
ncbi:MAG: iron-sulfur cluster assembly scaffold protein [Desulfosalsimonadaceae bacterium]